MSAHFGVALLQGQIVHTRKGYFIQNDGLEGEPGFTVKCQCRHNDGRTDTYEIKEGESLMIDEEAEIVLLNAPEVKAARERFDALMKARDPNWMNLEEYLHSSMYKHEIGDF